ncbi:hypothetical protein K469DRAFT_720701 [Zopfia rhizophila CBS 207.26]|uniref:Uncharacterized protein n=1 Tax=Zopfia rhizophila CBS 207.26 TaxID=1314779 RepID=A0A6A6DFZ0_9PEZI|nr:hypothetical protein K469DRAFT_720701 [Zopfia rhizophila CBS 207.26]
MASTAFSLETAMKSLYEEGFVDLNDPEVGELVSEMEKKSFPYLSPYGLDYCKQYVLNDTRIRSIIESLLSKCSLGHWLRYKALPGHIECFRKGGPEAGLRALIVQQWAKGSRVDYYGGSHQHDLPTEKGERSLHETSQAALDAASCKASEKEFPDGGLVIRDARLYAETKTGYAITFIFATDEVLAAWPKITLPNSPELVRKVVNMESPKIGVNFAIKDSAGSTNT